MSNAFLEGRALRRGTGTQGEIDLEKLAASMGLTIDAWELQDVDEVKVGDSIAVASRLSRPWRRWAIAHAIGHHMLHEGNHLWLRANTNLASKYEREAEEFARGLLVDDTEAGMAGLRSNWEIAEYFGVPEAMLHSDR